MTISVTGSDTDSGLSLKRKGLGISSDLMAKKKWEKKESKNGQRDSGIIVRCYQRPNHTPMILKHCQFCQKSFGTQQVVNQHITASKLFLKCGKTV